MAIFNAIATLLGLFLFLGIVWWAYSGARKKDNEEAALLPFSLEDEDRLNVEEESNKEDRHE